MIDPSPPPLFGRSWLLCFVFSIVAHLYAVEHSDFFYERIHLLCCETLDVHTITIVVRLQGLDWHSLVFPIKIQSSPRHRTLKREA